MRFLSTHLRMAAFVLAAYLLLLSVFVGENVRGGIEGGTAVGSESRGATVITYYVGGRQVVFAAAPAKAAVLSTVGVVAGIAAVASFVFSALRRRPGAHIEPVSSFPGAAFMGGLLGFITGMPLAVVMKEMDFGVFLATTVLLVTLGYLVLALVMRKMFGWGPFD